MKNINHILLFILILTTSCNQKSKKTTSYSYATEIESNDSTIKIGRKVIKNFKSYKSVDYNQIALHYDSLLVNHKLKPNAYHQHYEYNNMPFYKAYEIKQLSTFDDKLVSFLGHYDELYRFDSIKNREIGERKYDIGLYVDYKIFDSIINKFYLPSSNHSLIYEKNKETFLFDINRQSISKISRNFDLPMKIDWKFSQGDKMYGMIYIVSINDSLIYDNPYYPNESPEERIFHIHNYVTLDSKGKYKQIKLGEKLYEDQISIYQIYNSNKFLLKTKKDYNAKFYLVDTKEEKYTQITLGESKYDIYFISSDQSGDFLIFNKRIYEKGQFSRYQTVMYSIKEDTVFNIVTRNSIGIDEINCSTEYPIIGYNYDGEKKSSFNLISNVDANYSEPKFVEASKKKVIISYQFNPNLELLFVQIFNNEILKKDLIKSLSKKELWLLKNFIFAKNHYMFSNDYLQAYFNTFEFYYPSPKPNFKSNSTEISDRGYIRKKKDVQVNFSNSDSLNLDTIIKYH